MLEHRYVALKRLRCAAPGGKVIEVDAGEKIPAEATNFWPPQALRALLDTKHIDYAGAEERAAHDGKPREEAAPAVKRGRRKAA